MSATLTVRFKNIASAKPRWRTRARAYAKRAKHKAPQALAFVELYNAHRPFMTALLATRYRCVGYKRGKVLYLRRRGPWVRAGRVRKWSLGHGKHAIAVPVRDRVTGQKLVIVVAHLTWQHGRASYRRMEAKRLVALIEQAFPGWPVLAVGDWNDARKSTDSRPHDTTGVVMRAGGLHDLEADVPARDRRNDRCNSANQNRRKPPKNGIQLDRAFGTDDVHGETWALAIHGWPYDSDHWSLDLKIRIN